MASCARSCASSPATARHRLRRRSGAFEPRRDGVVGELGVIAHDGAVHGARGHLTRIVHRHVDDDREPLVAFAQRREVGRQLLRAASERCRPPCRPTSCWWRRGRRSPSPCLTSASTSAMATSTFACAAVRGARRTAGRGRANRRCRSSTREASRRSRISASDFSAGPPMAASSDRTAGEKSGCSPRCSITSWAMAARREGLARSVLFIDHMTVGTQHFPAMRAGAAGRMNSNALLISDQPQPHE